MHAVGTAFNVRLDAAEVEVLVTEGRVRVDPPRRAAPDEPKAPDGPGARVLAPVPIAGSEGAAAPPVLAARQRVIVGLGPDATPPQVMAVSSREIARVLAWRAPHLQFHELPLSKVAAEFNRHSRARLIVDASAADTLVAGSFRAENVELFVRFLEQAFGITAERRGDGTTILRKAE